MTMRLSRVALTVLTLISSVRAYADAPPRVAPSAVPGALIEIQSSAGTFMEVVLDVEGTRNLVLRFGEGHWETSDTILRDFNAARIYAPVMNPYAIVLVPVRGADGKSIVGYESRAVTYHVGAKIGRHFLVGMNGEIYKIGVHTDGTQSLQDNIPVKSGQTILEAIRDFNERAREFGTEANVREDVRVDRARELDTVDLAKARQQADLMVQAHDVVDTRAERAERAERGAGERVRTKDAVRKGRDVK